jgi:predicted transcriptional regulator
LATVRIYKVAELLGTTSQEVSALLKRDHGIDLKSASSTIEEVVARQFVEPRTPAHISARRRYPRGTPVVGRQEGQHARQEAAEPTRPAPPRLRRDRKDWRWIAV